jgi:ParB-like chromosome segregation protein Spo0J
MSRDACQPLCVVEVQITSLKAHPNNARTHSKHQIRQIADSIRIFGFTNPVLVNQENTIMAGRYEQGSNDPN